MKAESKTAGSCFPLTPLLPRKQTALTHGCKKRERRIFRPQERRLRIPAVPVTRSAGKQHRYNLHTYVRPGRIEVLDGEAMRFGLFLGLALVLLVLWVGSFVIFHVAGA